MKRYLRRGIARLLSSVLLLAAAAACDGDDPAPEFQVVTRHLAGGLLSVWGTSENDVYVVGAATNDGQGPAVLHFDGTGWTRFPTGQTTNLWWVYGFQNGPVFMGGEGGLILRYQNGTFTKMTTPGTNTIFGIWGSSPADVWAVGGAIGGSSGAFAWRLQGDTWVDAPGFPSGLAGTDVMWKMYGRAANDAWIIGTNGKAVRWDGAALTQVSTGLGESLFTVHADADRFVAVGGFGTGAILENEGGSWKRASPEGAPGFNGVYLSPAGDFAVGQEGVVFERGDAGAWTEVKTGLVLDETFHAVWVDPQGGVWAVGGRVLTRPITEGIIMYRGKKTIPDP